MATTWETVSTPFRDHRGDPYRIVLEENCFGPESEFDDLTLVLDHEDAQIIARTSDGTLNLSNAHSGLAFTADLSGAKLTKSMLRSIRDGIWSEVSAGFSPVKNKHRWIRVDDFEGERIK